MINQLFHHIKKKERGRGKKDNTQVLNKDRIRISRGRETYKNNIFLKVFHVKIVVFFAVHTMIHVSVPLCSFYIIGRGKDE